MRTVYSRDGATCIQLLTREDLSGAVRQMRDGTDDGYGFDGTDDELDEDGDYSDSPGPS